MTIEQFAQLGGFFVSLIFSFFPFLAAKFSEFSPQRKSGFILTINLAVAVGLFVYGCRNPALADFTCDVGGALNILVLFVNVLIGSGSAYIATRRLASK